MTELSAEHKDLIDQYLKRIENERIERRNKKMLPWAALFSAISLVLLAGLWQALRQAATEAGRESVEKSGELLKIQQVALDAVVTARSRSAGTEILVDHNIARSKEILVLAADHVKELQGIRVELEGARTSLATAAQYQKITGDIEAALRNNPDIGKALGASLVMPEGMVVAFNRSEKQGSCPKGWRVFEPAAGRFLVGAGIHTNRDMNDIAITNYPSFKDDPVKASGGEEKHRLSIDEMPNHSHVVYPHSGLIVGVSGTHRGAGSEDPNATSKTNGITSEVGGSQAHNVRPPYVALYFCMKE